ncbi:MAG TPA: hypothetical protein VG077_12285 [Verrucomicrobiae bacterium]|nr:hypothetical protein [Verrucomicrobiae bacterium]
MRRTQTLPFLLAAAVSLPAQILSPDTNLAARERQIVARSESDVHAAPRFNGAWVVGIYPETP